VWCVVDIISLDVELQILQTILGSHFKINRRHGGKRNYKWLDV